MSEDSFGSGPHCSAAHVEAASGLLSLILYVAAFLGITLLTGGIYLAFSDKLANTSFRLLGNDFTSTSVGVSMAFIGAVLAILVIRRVLASIDHLAALPVDQAEN